MLSRRMSCSLPSSSVDGGERLVRLARRVVVVELDVVDLGAADDRLLLLGRQRRPGRQIVQVLLHDDVAAAGEVGILVADERRRRAGRGRSGSRCRRRSRAGRGRRSSESPVTSSTTAHGVAEPVEQQPLELEAQVVALGADVEEQVARRRRRACTGPRIAANGAAPRARPGEAGPRAARPMPTMHDSRPPRSRKPTVLTSRRPRRARRGPCERGIAARRCHHEEDRRARQRRVDALRVDRHAVPRSVLHRVDVLTPDDRPGPELAARSPGAMPSSVRARSARPHSAGLAGLGRVRDVARDLSRVAGGRVDGELPVGSVAVAQDAADAFQFAVAPDRACVT